MIYVFIFWGLSRGIEALIHKFDKREKCICEPTIEVVKETVVEEKIIEVTPEVKEKSNVVTEDVKKETINETKEKNINKYTKTSYKK